MSYSISMCAGINVTKNIRVVEYMLGITLLLDWTPMH